MAMTTASRRSAVWPIIKNEFPDMDKDFYTPEEAYELTMKDIEAVYGVKDAV